MQITPFTDLNIFADDLVSAHRHQINTPQLNNYETQVENGLISPNGQFIAIRQNMYPLYKETNGFPNVQLYNVITGEELYSQTWKEDCSLISIQFSIDSSLFVMLDRENLNIINLQEINKISIIKLKSKNLVSIDTENNISILLLNNSIIVYSTKNGFQFTLQFDSEINHLSMIGLNNAIYSCGFYQYLLNLQNKKVLRRWMNHEYEITDQINYKNFLVIQSCGYNIKLVYIRLQQQGKIIRKYLNNHIRQGQNRITYDNSSISIYSFVHCRIKQPILNPNKSVFKIQLNVNKFDLLQGRLKYYNFKIDQDYDSIREIPIYFLKDNELKYYLFL